MFKVLVIALVGAMAVMASDVPLYAEPLGVDVTSSVGESFLRDSRVLERGSSGLLGYNSFLGYPGYSNRFLSAYDRVAYNREAFGRSGYNRFLGYPRFGLYPNGLFF